VGEAPSEMSQRERQKGVGEILAEGALGLRRSRRVGQFFFSFIFKEKRTLIVLCNWNNNSLRHTVFTFKNGAENRPMILRLHQNRRR